MQQQLKALHNMIGETVVKEWKGAEDEVRKRFRIALWFENILQDSHAAVSSAQEMTQS